MWVSQCDMLKCGEITGMTERISAGERHADQVAVDVCFKAVARMSLLTQ